MQENTRGVHENQTVPKLHNNEVRLHLKTPKISITQKPNIRIEGCVTHREVSNEDDENDDDEVVEI